ncbi:ribonuclease H-like domain-containing protein [Fictibacillus iocasae]|uniref:Ribonuclease H-like domain-containing protein n=1 Tax=Fictibacillus iocasae TaxID=2715437 RepID=A0ABW2NMY3_9BACL
MALKKKLNRLKRHMSHESPIIKELETASAPNMADKVAHLSYWEENGAAPYFFDEDHCIIKERVLSKETSWGKYKLADLEEVVEEWNRQKSAHPLCADGLEASDLMFFDTETTGLSGGAGNTIFMLGMSRLTGDHVKVQQYFLPQPGSEIAMYHYFLHHINELKNLVTYNGKSFDWPQVKTRHTLIRDYVPSLPEFGHFDLLHGSRRIWKDTLPSVKLAIVEKEILDVRRVEDTPGYLAPMLYFHYLQEKDPSLLKGVFAHNEWDVLSLMTLYIHLSKMIQGLTYTTGKETFETGRWLESAGELDLAIVKYDEVMKSDEIHFYHAATGKARILKKKKKHEQASSFWEKALSVSVFNEEPAVELSKYYEHHTKDTEKALYYARVALEKWQGRQRILKTKELKEKEAFLIRIERLEKRMMKENGFAIVTE